MVSEIRSNGVLAMIEIRFNGESKSVSSSTVAELLSELSLLGKKVAVELNREIVSRTAYESTNLSAGDSVEIVHFVGGG